MIQDKVFQLLEVLVWNRLKATTSEKLALTNQFGFTPGRDTCQHLLRTRNALTNGLLGCFLDLRKAFDSVPRSYVCMCLAEHMGNLTGRMVGLIARMTCATRKVTIAPASEGVTMDVERGVPQGGVLSPWLFACIMNP